MSLPEAVQALQNILIDYETLLQQYEEQLQGNIAAHDLTIDILTQGYLKLPVVGKPMAMGPRGGLFYVNRLGNQVYLKRYQRLQCRSHSLKGDGEFCRGTFPAPVVNA